MKDILKMQLRSISPAAANALLDQGTVLVDIREPQERARISIPGSDSLPLSRLAAAPLPANAKAIVFHCTTGKRTRENAATLAAAAECEAYALEGGLEAWRAAGLPVSIDRSQPIEIMRQVQIAAGSLVLLGIALGIFVSEYWYGMAAFIDAGLVFAGVTGTCTMAKMLELMPWNRRPA